MNTDLPIEALTRLLSDKPELAAALRGAATPDAAAETLARVAAENGIAVDKADLLAFHAERAGQANAALSDADLDHVAGGDAVDAVVFSFLTMGLGCAVASIEGATGPDQDCGKRLRRVTFG